MITKQHTQKPYCLTEAAIQFTLIIFDLGHWADPDHQLSQVHVKPMEAYLGKDRKPIDDFLRGLRQMNAEQKPFSEVDKIFGELASQSSIESHLQISCYHGQPKINSVLVINNKKRLILISALVNL